MVNPPLVDPPVLDVVPVLDAPVGPLVLDVVDVSVLLAMLPLDAPPPPPVPTA
jgi:hypothetical protein